MANHDFVADGPIRLPGGARLDLVEPYQPAGHIGPNAPVRLWTARLRLPRPLDEHLNRLGRPIRYGEVARHWPLSAYQTVFATVPGSAEMPSAARGFTPELVTRLVSEGVILAPITLHAGVASQEAGEMPLRSRPDSPATNSATSTSSCLG